MLRSIPIIVAVLLIVGITGLGADPYSGGTLLFHENFEALGDWYDGTAISIVAGGQSGNCAQWAWAESASTPTNWETIRRLFTSTDELLVSYYVKLDTGWVGHQAAEGGPHLFNILSSADGEYGSTAWSNLNTYFEFYSNIGTPYTTYPIFTIQDSARVNTSNGTPPVDLTAVTENRSVAGCNGTLGDAGDGGDCYQSTNWYNGREWQSATAITKNTWVKVTTYLKMNTTVTGTTNADGIMRQWLDNDLVMEQTGIVFRTSDQPTKEWNKFVLAPFMGESPIAQTMWVDELSVYDGIATTTTTITGTFSGVLR